MIATEHADRLEERYAPSYIETAKHLFDDGSMSAVSDILQEREVISIHDVREGGIFAALWEMAAAKNVGLSVDLKNIPIRQHTIEVCEYFNLNPFSEVLKNEPLHRSGSGGHFLMLSDRSLPILCRLSETVLLIQLHLHRQEARFHRTDAQNRQ